MLNLVLIALSIFSYLPAFAPAAHAQGLDYDLGVAHSNISFVPNTFVAGTPVRIYATVHNYGNKDITGSVSFLLNNVAIGDPQTVSARAGGNDEDVFVDWTIPSSQFNVLVRIIGTNPTDQNTTNNETLSSLITPKKDTDGDGIADDSDNCPNVSNFDQRDINGNGIGDVCEPPPPPPPPPVVVISPPAPKPTPAPAPTPVPPPVVVQTNTNDIKTTDQTSTNEPAPVPDASTTDADAGQWRPAMDFEQLDWNVYKFYAIVYPSDSPAFKYQWNFGDGQTSEEKTPTHTYEKSGKFLVTLQIEDGSDKVRTLSSLVEISFLNWGNWRLKALLSFLALFAIVSLVLATFAHEKGELDEENFTASPKVVAKMAADFLDPDDKLQKYIDSIVDDKESSAVKRFNKKYSEAENKLASSSSLEAPLTKSEAEKDNEKIN